MSLVEFTVAALLTLLLLLGAAKLIGLLAHIRTHTLTTLTEIEITKTLHKGLTQLLSRAGETSCGNLLEKRHRQTGFPFFHLLDNQGYIEPIHIRSKQRNHEITVSYLEPLPGKIITVSGNALWLSTVDKITEGDIVALSNCDEIQFFSVQEIATRQNRLLFTKSVSLADSTWRIAKLKVYDLYINTNQQTLVVKDLISQHHEGWVSRITAMQLFEIKSKIDCVRSDHAELCWPMTRLYQLKLGYMLEEAGKTYDKRIVDYFALNRWK